MQRAEEVLIVQIRVSDLPPDSVSGPAVSAFQEVRIETRLPSSKLAYLIARAVENAKKTVMPDLLVAETEDLLRFEGQRDVALDDAVSVPAISQYEGKRGRHPGDCQCSRHRTYPSLAEAGIEPRCMPEMVVKETPRPARRVRRGKT